ncbi:MAG: hypothetical protein HC933_09005 [Pleurocapsa sp. SU_196_0]|nr:hypothetical protein [Pleurocapsa sp. SU_196_0]
MNWRRAFSGCGVVATLVVPIAACGQEGAPQSAAQLYRSGKYAEAIRSAEAAVASDSSHPASIVLVRALSGGRAMEGVRR